MIDKTDEELAEFIAGFLGCDVKGLYHQPLRQIYQALDEYNKQEIIQIIKRLARTECVPHRYIDDTPSEFYTRP